MSVITVRRTIRTGSSPLRRKRPSFRKLTRRYFAREHSWQFGIEALIFAVIATVSAWPIILAAQALNDLLRGIG